MIRPSPARTRTEETAATTHPNGERSLEEQLARLQEQMDRLHAQVRQAQQLSSLGIAATTIAHEVNNLLTPILGYVDAALASSDATLMTKALGVTQKNVRILVGMSQRVLHIGAAKAPQRDRVNVRHVVDEALASLCRDPAKDGITVSIEVDAALTAHVDPLQLQQVLFNLLLNAREAMAKEHGGRLCVTARREGESVVLRVRNTGDPIPAERLPWLFDAFETSKPITADPDARCGGLGLALCRDLIEENDGAITVASDAANGTTFTIKLPANRADCS
jgi:signal transduction histidine kinase